MSERISGKITTSATTRVAVRNTTYTQQASGAQRSMKSSSASDTAAGTGARTVQITYFTLTSGVIAGPLTETITLNGTAAVDTVATDICYIERMDVLTVGSGAVAAGTISLYTAVTGGGSAFGSIAAADTQTRWAHHYVPDGQVCIVKDIYAENTGVSTATTALEAWTKNPAVSAAAEVSMFEAVVTQGLTNTTHVQFNTRIGVTGPAVIVLYATPGDTGSQVTTAQMSIRRDV